MNYLQHTSIGTFNEDLEGTAITQYHLQEYTGGPVLNLVGWYNGGLSARAALAAWLKVDWTSPGAGGAAG